MSAPINAITLPIGSLTAKAQISDYTSGEVFSAYKNAVTTLQTLSADSTPDPAQLQEQIEILKSLLLNGIDQTYDIDPSLKRKMFLTQEQAQQLQLFFQSLSLSGIDYSPDTVNVTQSQANLWSHVVNQPIDVDADNNPITMLGALFDFVTVTVNHSIQSLIELQYVKEGNDLLSEQLSSLQNAIGTTNEVLNTLANLQDMHNRVEVPSKPPFSTFFPYNRQDLSPDDYVNEYRKAASAYYGTPVSPVLDTKAFPPSSNAFTVPPIGTSQGTYVFSGNGASTNESSGYNNFIGVLSDASKALDGGNTSQYRMLLCVPSVNTFTELDGQGNFVAEYRLYTIYDSDGSIAATNARIPINGFEPDPINAQGSFTLLMKRNNSALSTADLNDYTEFNYNSGPNAGNLQDVSIQVKIPTNDPNVFVVDAQFTAMSVISNDRVVGLLGQYTGLTPTGFTQGTLYSDFLKIKQLSAVNNLAIAGAPLAITGFKNTTVATKALIDYFTTGPALSNLLFGKIQLLASGAQFLKWDANLRKLFILNAQSAVSIMKTIVKLRNQISAQLATLSAITPSGSSDSASLLVRLRTVYNDLVRTFVTAGGQKITSATGLSAAIKGLSSWLLDNYSVRNDPNATNAGLIQQNLTFAITAGQSLNDSQKEKVRNFLFVFEEYYKSASAVLQKLTQIIERVAQGITR